MNKSVGMYENGAQLTAESVLILHILELLGEPVSDRVLTEVLLAPGLVNYFSAHSCLAGLTDGGYVARKLDSIGTVMYDITGSGRETLKSLKHMLSGGLGAAYESYVENHRADLQQSLRVDGVCSEDRKGNLLVHCYVRDGLQCYFDLTVPVANKADADAAIRNWRTDSARIYIEILKTLTKEEGNRT